MFIHHKGHKLSNFTFLSKVFLCGPVSSSQVLFCLLVVVLALQFVKLKISHDNSFRDFLPDVLSIVQVFEDKVLRKINGFGEWFHLKIFLLKMVVNFGFEDEKFWEKVLKLGVDDHVFGLV